MTAVRWGDKILVLSLPPIALQARRLRFYQRSQCSSLRFLDSRPGRAVRCPDEQPVGNFTCSPSHRATDTNRRRQLAACVEPEDLPAAQRQHLAKCPSIQEAFLGFRCSAHFLASINLVTTIWAHLRALYFLYGEPDRWIIRCWGENRPFWADIRGADFLKNPV